MPMTFTDDMVAARAKILGVEPTREAVAKATEEMYRDFVEAWEIRSGRPWTEMTAAEAKALTQEHPETLRNPAVLTRMLRG